MSHPQVPSPSRPNAIPSVQPRNDLEKYYAELDQPVSGKIYKSDGDLNMMFLSQGHTEEELPGLRKQWDENCNDFFKSWDVKYKIVGRKPKPGDTFTVFQIPGSQHAIRIWDGGMDSCGLFFLDYYDVEKGVPVNTPHGYEIYPVEIPGVLTLPGPLRSLEYACQNLRPDEIYDGREKFCVSKGSHWRLVREGHSDVLFATPTYAEGLPTQYVTGKLCQSLPH